MDVYQIKKVLNYNIFHYIGQQGRMYAIAMFIDYPPQYSELRQIAIKIRRLSEIADFSFTPSATSRKQLRKKITVLSMKIKNLNKLKL